ncbi:MAG: type IX secretion system membrane protein PorP/SprF [Reichenbachiella sp.]
MKKIGLIVLLGVSFFAVQGQQRAIFSQYMFNGISINPAYTGVHGVPYISVIAKVSDLDIEGAPKTQSLAFHTLTKNRYIGLGFMIVNDQVAVSKQTGFYVTASYKIPFRKSTFSFGMQGGMTSNNTNFNELNIYHANQQVLIGGNDFSDPSFNYGQVKRNYFNTGAGILYSSSSYYFGLSSPFLINHRVTESGSANPIDQLRHIFVTGGYIFDLYPSIRFRPTFLYKHVYANPSQLDVSASFLWNNKVWVGMTYRTSGVFATFFEIQINNNLAFGYSYDFPSNKNIALQMNSHEILISYRLLREKKVVLSPRLF